MNGIGTFLRRTLIGLFASGFAMAVASVVLYIRGDVDLFAITLFGTGYRAMGLVVGGILVWGFISLIKEVWGDHESCYDDLIGS